MNTANRKLTIVATILGLATGVAAMLAWAGGQDGIVEAKKPAAMTVHVGGHGGDGIAKKLNELHVKMAGDGWQFADMEPHSENGDTEGAWVTYTKP